MASAAERFFALPEIPLTDIESQHHIFAAAFYRGVRYQHDRLAAAAQPLIGLNLAKMSPDAR